VATRRAATGLSAGRGRAGSPSVGRRVLIVRSRKVRWRRQAGPSARSGSLCNLAPASDEVGESYAQG